MESLIHGFIGSSLHAVWLFSIGEIWHKILTVIEFTLNPTCYISCVIGLDGSAFSFLQGFTRFIQWVIPQHKQLTANTDSLLLIIYNAADLYSADCTDYCPPHLNSSFTQRHSSDTGPSSFSMIPILCICSHSGLYGREHLPASQRGRYLCQICPQVVLWYCHQELHTLLVWWLWWKPEPLRNTRAVCEGLWETRYVFFIVFKNNNVRQHTKQHLVSFINELRCDRSNPLSVSSLRIRYQISITLDRHMVAWDSGYVWTDSTKINFLHKRDFLCRDILRLKQKRAFLFTMWKVSILRGWSKCSHKRTPVAEMPHKG